MIAMSSEFSYLLNGRATGGFVKADTLVKRKIAHALAASSEYNSGNAWNVNINNGNLNANNKYNNNYVRACAALGDKEIEDWIEAFDDCCYKKKTSNQCAFYRTYYEEDLLKLAAEVYSQTYKPSVSICFVVTRPKLREVFAANFRDRIVQHWVCLRLNPFFEERFQAQGDVSFNCRAGYGTLNAVQTLDEKIKKVTANYTRQAYIGKFDLKSFFMSIDKEIVLRQLIDLIEAKYERSDKESLLYAVEQIVMHRPQDNCQKKGDPNLWDDLPKSKSLFNISGDVGLPIGNLTSQLFANYYMSFFDEWVLDTIAPYNGEYIRFVDDFVLVIPTIQSNNGKEVIKKIHIEAKEWLKVHLHLSLHPDKVYIQEAKKGVSFVGCVIKPNRIYTSNRTVNSFINKLKDFDEFCFDLECGKDKDEYDLSTNHLKWLERDMSSLNSYTGLMLYSNSYAIRAREIFKMRYMWKFVYVRGRIQIFTLKNKYKVVNKLSNNENMELWERGSKGHHNFPIFGDACLHD